MSFFFFFFLLHHRNSEMHKMKCTFIPLYSEIVFDIKSLQCAHLWLQQLLSLCCQWNSFSAQHLTFKFKIKLTWDNFRFLQTDHSSTCAHTESIQRLRMDVDLKKTQISAELCIFAFCLELCLTFTVVGLRRGHFTASMEKRNETNAFSAHTDMWALFN